MDSLHFFINIYYIFLSQASQYVDDISTGIIMVLWRSRLKLVSSWFLIVLYVPSNQVLSTISGLLSYILQQ